MQNSFIAALSILILVSCNKNTNKADAYGNFESTEVIVSAEASGKILNLDVEEGKTLDAGAVVCIIDTTQLHLKKGQLLASRKATASRTGNIVAQMDVLKQQKAVLQKDQERISNLVKERAATQKQLDDINGQISVIDEQIKSIESQNGPISNELNSFDSQMDQINDQISKSVIRNPVKGTVLAKYAETSEVTAFGKPLYKIANLYSVILRVYVSGAQLPSIKIGQQVRVFYDKNEKENTEITGIVSWISSTAEFTPKIIQTKEERVNMVYAVKVNVKNDGSLKIGMPGEVVFK